MKPVCDRRSFIIAKPAYGENNSRRRRDSQRIMEAGRGADQSIFTAACSELFKNSKK